ncbi:hypothetical protein CJ030_MR8G026764 [Morella rubra]|uniref:Uncharacterized protein n=1 Tax=Morella rubra TaxID=262757 RepID=A0A6A1USG8_9ROSI|nr:hypothetical protein CJ030_MR8G026764 [Morella rubra]
MQECGNPDSKMLLSGKKILVSEVGASVELSENGQEVLELVGKGLSAQRECGALKTLPYDAFKLVLAALKGLIQSKGGEGSETCVY